MYSPGASGAEGLEVLQGGGQVNQVQATVEVAVVAGLHALQEVHELADLHQGELVGYEACRLLQLLRGEPLLRGEVLLQVGQLNHKPALQAGPAVGPLHHTELGRHAAEDEVHVPGMAQLVLPARVEVLQEALTVAVAAHAQALSRVCGPPLLQGF